MAIKISTTARQWGVGRETIYRRQLAGELSFATVDPPTIEATEMLRAFGKPQPKAKKATVGIEAVALERVDVVCDMLKAEAERLKADLTVIKKQLDVAREEACREQERWRELFLTQQMLIETHDEKSMLLLERVEKAVAQVLLATGPDVMSQSEQLQLERGEVVAQAVFAAQQRVSSQAGQSTRHLNKVK